jgi:CheY-like chemotaxis protein
VPHKLLLADDSVTIQRVIELTFAEEDITVLAVGDGRQAIELVQSERPDIVLADIGMPERDGYEVAAFIKGRPDLAHIPVLLLTGAFEPIDEGRAKAAGCDGVLVKPFEPHMVISRVKDLIAGRRPAADLPAQQAPSPETVRVARGPEAVDTPPPATAVPAEAYFDRLDAAFASRETAPPAPAGPMPEDSFDITPESTGEPGFGLADTLASWDPATSARPPVRHAEPTSSTPLPTLAEAFAALLAAEKGQPVIPAALARDGVDDDVIEQVTRRVIERLGDAAVRDVVIEVAERLIKEEIARIKSGSR